jgi:hypothetical protein
MSFNNSSSSFYPSSNEEENSQVYHPTNNLFLNNNLSLQTSLDEDEEVKDPIQQFSNLSFNSQERNIMVKFADEVSSAGFINVPIGENLLRELSHRSQYLKSLFSDQFQFPTQIDFTVIGLTYDFFIQLVNYLETGIMPQIKTCINNDYYVNIFSFLGLDELIKMFSSKQKDLYLLSDVDTAIRNKEIQDRMYRLSNENIDLRYEDRNFILHDSNSIGTIEVEEPKNICNWYKLTGRFSNHRFDSNFNLPSTRKFNLCSKHIKELYQKYPFDKAIEILLGYSSSDCSEEKDISVNTVCLDTRKSDSSFQEGLLSNRYRLHKSNGYWCLGAPNPRNLQVSNIRSKYASTVLGEFELKPNLSLAGGAVNSMILNQNINDLDIFCITKDVHQARMEIRRLYNYLLTKTVDKIIILRNTHAITFKSENIKVQFILRLYNSIVQVISGFDIDSCCVAYDGDHVYGMDRYVRSVTYGYNFTDPDRQSLNYIGRLMKYQKRGFAICLPGYDPDRVNIRKMAKQFCINKSYIGFNTRHKSHKRWENQRKNKEYKKRNKPLINSYSFVIEPNATNTGIISTHDSWYLFGSHYAYIFNTPIVYNHSPEQLRYNDKGEIIRQRHLPARNNLIVNVDSIPDLVVPNRDEFQVQIRRRREGEEEIHKYILDIHNLNSYIILPKDYKDLLQQSVALKDKYKLKVRLLGQDRYDEHYENENENDEDRAIFPDEANEIEIDMDKLSEYIIKKDQYINFKFILTIPDPDFEPEDFTSLWIPVQERITELRKIKYTGLAKLFQIYMKWCLIPKAIKFSYENNKKDVKSIEDFVNDTEQNISDYTNYSFTGSLYSVVTTLSNSLRARFIKSMTHEELLQYYQQIEYLKANPEITQYPKDIIYYVSSRPVTFNIFSSLFDVIIESTSDERSQEGLYYNNIHYTSLYEIIQKSGKTMSQYYLFIEKIVNSQSKPLTLNFAISDNIDQISDLNIDFVPFQLVEDPDDIPFNGLLHDIKRTNEIIEDLNSYQYQYTLSRYIDFITENPGTQFSGSFHPVYDEWYEQLYCLPAV